MHEKNVHQSQSMEAIFSPRNTFQELFMVPKCINYNFNRLHTDTIGIRREISSVLVLLQMLSRTLAENTIKICTMAT